jgi:hypothetical protein
METIPLKLRNARVRQTVLLLASVLVLTTTAAKPAKADTVPLSFDASLTMGSLADTNFTGIFSYDNSGLTGHGQEFLSLISFDFTLLGTHFTQADIRQGGQAIFQDGVLQDVTAAFYQLQSPNPPLNNITFGFGGPGIIGYIDLKGKFGDGVFTISSVPESSTFLSLAVGLGLLAIIKMKRV